MLTDELITQVLSYGAVHTARLQQVMKQVMRALLYFKAPQLVNAELCLDLLATAATSLQQVLRSKRSAGL